MGRSDNKEYWTLYGLPTFLCRIVGLVLVLDLGNADGGVVLAVVVVAVLEVVAGETLGGALLLGTLHL